MYIPVAVANSTGARLRNAPYIARSTVADANNRRRPGMTWSCRAILITASPTASNIVATIMNARAFITRKMLSWAVDGDKLFRFGHKRTAHAWTNDIDKESDSDGD